MQLTRSGRLRNAVLVVLVLGLTAGACGKKKPPVARPSPPPPGGTMTSGSGTGSNRPPSPPEPIAEPSIVPPEPVPNDAVGSRSIDELNRESPFKPVYFELDGSEIGAEGQSALQGNAALMRQYSTWTVTIEGHCDERGTAEYNLALGERRAVSARNYLVSLGISADRLRIVTYGKEFPFDPGHDESAWSKNRRAHFVVTGK